MKTDRTLERLLAGKFADADGGGLLSVATRKIVIEKSIAADPASCLSDVAIDGKVAVVDDPTTHEILGARLIRALSGRRHVAHVRLGDLPHADMETVAHVEAVTAGCDALVAVGSGTINDICKYVAARAGKPYAVFATAPSMNGYVSTTAAITVHGHKKSLAACAPTAAIFDLGILAAAPKRMIRSGLGDSLCRPTAQADWLLAHLLFDLPYRRMPFDLLAEDEPTLFASASGLVEGDLAAIESLVRTLLLSGFGTAICGSSHPASQGEHLISHFVDMMGDPGWPAAFHGEQVGVATLTMADLQMRCLQKDRPQLHADAAGEAEVRKIFGADLGAECWKEFAAKRTTQASVDALNARLHEKWPEIRAAISKVARSAQDLADVLRRAGAPTRAEELGWPAEFYAHAVSTARLIRNRYTFLDFAAGQGLLPVS